MKFGKLTAFLLAAGLSAAMDGVAADSCIAKGDERVINAALRAATSVTLCRNAVFEIFHTIELNTDGQELFTRGQPTDDSRAVIRVVGDELATAVQSRASNIFLHDVVIDGQRPALGRLDRGGALIEVGGDVTGVRVEHVRAFDPRGWSTLHVFEGARHCTNARVIGNTIGPAGTAVGNMWADGISFACRNGLVADNTVVDASDGGIVIFGAPGTIVENNIVKSRHNVMLGGINLVDYRPFDGDYSGVIVRGNRIETRGGFMKIAIAIGPAAWGIGTLEQTNRGGTVVGNLISGDGFGYGIVVDGASDFTVTGNHVSGHSKGWSGERCDKNHAPPGLKYLRDPNATAGSYQTNFRRGIARWSICVQPPR